ncbi:hypothetical protein C3E97_015290 [Pseudomonas sp. MWU12-2115]|nr:hypothetical protein C3E97_015290 [Pseudomonas sp. MWU12-2115]
MGVIDSGMAESGGYCPTSKGNIVQTVGAGLLAKAACPPTHRLNDTPHSRASPLPQGICSDS